MDKYRIGVKRNIMLLCIKVVDETTIVMAEHGKIFSFIWFGATQNNAGKMGSSYLPPGMPIHMHIPMEERKNPCTVFG